MVTSVTALGRNGLSDWLIQRVTAVVLLAYTIFIVAFILSCDTLDYPTWVALFNNTAMRIFTMLAVLSLVAHAWIGLWAVTTDYLTTRMVGGKATFLRLLVQISGIMVFAIYLLWGIEILWGY